MNRDIQVVKQERRELIAEMRMLLDRATQAKRDLTVEETRRYDENNIKVDKLQAEIENLESANPITWNSRNSMPGPKADTFNYRSNPNAGDLRTAFSRWLEYGDRGVSQQEFRDLSQGSSGSGGYLVLPVALSEIILHNLREDLLAFTLSKVVPVKGAATLGLPVITDPSAASWVTEITSSVADSTMATGRKDLAQYPLSKLLLVSNSFLRNASFSPEAVCEEALTFAMQSAIEDAWLNGDSSSKPTGIFYQASPGFGITTGRDVDTGNSSTTVTFDNLMEVIGSVEPKYQKGACFVISQKLATQLQRQKDGNANYIWSNAVVQGQPNMLLGYPVYVSSFCPDTPGSGNYAGVFGNFARGYVFSVNQQIEVKRLDQLYALSDQTALLLRASLDGMPCIEECFARITYA